MTSPDFLLQALQPLPGWGPALDRYRTGKYASTSSDGSARKMDMDGMDNNGYSNGELAKY